MRFTSFAVTAFLCLATNEIINNEENQLRVNAFAPSSHRGRVGVSNDNKILNNGARISSRSSSSTSLFMSSRQQTGRDFYRILGVNRNADAKDIKAAYRGMAKKYHPGMLRRFQNLQKKVSHYKHF
jgi:DnaJ-domain-containing protein 1